MKKIITIIALICIFYFGFTHLNVNHKPTHKDNPVAQTSQTYNTPSNGQQFSENGEVIQILSDDNIGSRHQRFILRLPSNQTILIAHNIDIAPRIPSLKIGDIISFNGVYESNSKGGVVHWTHRDPNGHHKAGWLQKNGQTYQ